MTEHTRQNFEATVLRRLRGLGRRLRLYLFVDGLAVVSVAILASMLITFIVDRTFWLAHDMRLVQLTSLLLVLAGIAWWYIARPLSIRVRDVDLALLVERAFPQLESRLVSAVDFHAGAVGAGSAASAPMIERTVRDAEARVAELDFTRTLSARRFGRRAVVTLGCLIVFALVTATARETTRLWFDRNVLLRDVHWPIRNRMVVEGLKDGVMIVPRGDDVTVSAVVEEGYAPPRQCYVQFEGEDRHRGREQMPAILSESEDAPVRFTHTFERVDQTLTCRIVGGDFRSEPFVLQVVDRPRVAQVVIGITPPEYTQLEPYELRAGQTVAEALKGSRIRLRVSTNKPLASALLIRQSAGHEQEIGQANRLGELDYFAADLPDASASYYFRMEDTMGLSNISDRSPPVRMSLRLVSDKPPAVKMRIRGVGDMITAAAVLPIEAEFSDMYGLASAALVHALSREGSTPGTQLLTGFEPGSKVFSRTLDWSAPAHGVAEGDRLTLLAAATDFDTISGPNRGESSATVLRVVSREELMAELNRREQEYRQDFERLLNQQEELYGELLSLAGNMGAQTADASRRLGQLARLQRDFGGRANGLRLQFEQILSELRISQLSSAAAEARLGGGIVEPMTFLSRTRMPVAAEQLEALGRETTAENMQVARNTQAEMIAEMQRILTAMLKWEGFQEAVSLLREVLKLQGNLSQETEKRIEAEVFGIGTETAPSN